LRERLLLLLLKGNGEADGSDSDVCPD
jgi:hypothetical protein